MKQLLLLFTLVLCFGSSGAAAEPWQLTGWTARAIVTIAKPSANKEVDCASVKIVTHGRGKPDGSDFRVLDVAGKVVPFQLTFHDPARYSLLTFRCVDPKTTYFIYFGNAAAPTIPEQIVLADKPGIGEPKGAWVPKFGLVYETRARPRAQEIKDEKNPQTVEDLQKMLLASPRKFGARQQPRIADGYNPFGPSDYYISIYRGWLHIPKAGKYRFCTVSNEASFSFMDGKELIHWPGRHTAERGARGEKNALVELTAGPHYVEYYHEEVTLEQLSYLGWRPAADEGAFAAIPENLFPLPHETSVKYEDAKGSLPTFEPVITDSIWPVERTEGQYTRAKFVAAPMPAGTKFAWDFGDGQSGAGESIEHVYLLADKIYMVTLTCEGPNGKHSAKWPLEIFDIEHVTDQYKEGRPKDYAKLSKTYDLAKLEMLALRELAHLFAEAEENADAIKTCEDFVKRFSSADPFVVARVKRLLADCQLRTGASNLEAAIANYRASVIDKMPASEQLQVLGRLIRLLGVERGEPDKALEVYKQVEELLKKSRPDEDGLKAHRQVLMAAGDAMLWGNKTNAAREFYAKAEALRENPIPPQVRAAKIGSYPNSLREYLAGGNHGAAIDLVNEWEDFFPTDKLNGQTFFWRGKLFTLRGQPVEGAKYLARAVEVTLGATYETEARWLLAQALEQSGKLAEAKRELQKLIKTGFNDEYTKKAREKLK